ncbi:MAG: hypothetical protein HY790_10445 [Deltaproteobacteria bacterium]|nr:hypothetical protein [Deltaproteobacteria bacterium]MBI4796233.1 hypothetical protein [Deltaproteobacteria bacterium]
MTHYGLQTMDFLDRIKKFEGELPPLLLEMAELLKRMITEIERPQLEDVQRMQAELRRMIGGSERLVAVCGAEGKLCLQCPFGAYLPSGFPFASPEQPLCLPWIVLTYPEAQVQPASQ